jgi:hypothetical protein
MADAASINASFPDRSIAQVAAARLQELSVPGLAALLQAEGTAQAPSGDFVALLSSGSSNQAADTFVSPYRLGLHAAQNPGQGNPATEQLAIQPAQVEAPFAASVPVLDPTQSSLFQAHLGGLAAQLGPASAGLNQGALEAPATLRVMATFAGAPTQAFTEGRPPSANLRELGQAESSARRASAGGVLPIGEGVAPAYDPAGGSVPSGARIGTLMDLSG